MNKLFLQLYAPPCGTYVILLRRRKQFKGGNHTREYSMLNFKFLKYNYSTNFFGTSAVQF